MGKTKQQIEIEEMCEAAGWKLKLTVTGGWWLQRPNSKYTDLILSNLDIAEKVVAALTSLTDEAEAYEAVKELWGIEFVNPPMTKAEQNRMLAEKIGMDPDEFYAIWDTEDD